MSSFAQIEYDEVPMNLQFFQRDSASKAVVPFSGRVTSKFEKITLEVYRNTELINTLTQNLTYQNNVAPFKFNPEIKAELAEYNFKIFLSDSLVLEIKRIVAGETILMYGQSNAHAVPLDYEDYHFTSIWGRTVNVYDIPNKYGYWMEFLAFNKQFNGVFALEIAKKLIEIEKIPVCLINGAEGAKSIVDLSIRNDINPQDWTTYYGNFLTKIHFAKLNNTARILVWRQGENEAVDSPMVKSYQSNFDKLRKNLKIDLPSLQKIYVVQNNILTYESPNAGDLRDIQRNFRNVYPDVESIASVGTVGYDGLHYNKDGYVQNGFEVSRLIQRDFFLKTQTEITSPDIKKAFFTSEKDSIILVFDDESVKMKVDEDLKLSNGKTRSIKDFFYLDGKDGLVSNVAAEANKIILKLKESSNAKTINYLPHYFIDITTTGSYTGPYLKNSNGMRAFTFANINIEEPQPKPQTQQPQTNDILLSNSKYFLKPIYLFPNPVLKGNKIYLKNIELKAQKICIYSLIGHDLFELSPTNTDLIEIPTDKLNLGVYLINIQKKEGSNLTLKFIVQ